MSKFFKQNSNLIADTRHINPKSPISVRSNAFNFPLLSTKAFEI
ncbi:hypothetical protein [Flavobacterium sp. CAN_S2]